MAATLLRLLAQVAALGRKQQWAAAVGAADTVRRRFDASSVQLSDQPTSGCDFGG